MHLFYTIPTDSFVPLSHDKAYLFVHYDKIANFLSLHMNRKYRHMLAKPIKNNYDIEWYSPYNNLKPNERSSVSEHSNEKYWEFYNELESKIKQLSRANDENARDWMSLLNKVFSPENNILFTNGTDICIVWGWKFENNQIVRPDLLMSTNDQLEVSNQDVDELTNFSDQSKIESEANSGEKVSNKEEDKLVEEEFFWRDESEVQEQVIIDPTDKETMPAEAKPSFLEFLKYFASKYWWLLIVLLALLAFILLYKSLTI
ncbi:hypothetical protein SAMN05660841_04095 [Sphingobacterium nematocida]|uniref:Uncharacterized protein n=1 Tax=Sphingobacterium nematocida TaxID=1513896 RepID=A0A1T5GIE6_9SPHI|nr:hypothetical protein [Sphingobacterium nematocida]SKC08110.1 hypothetical protein SAMN05660841_04095 [Sphingobacterium nematocida]